MNSTLVYAIVDQGKAELMMNTAKAAGSTGGTILFARGTASSSLLCMLGLGDSSKEILMTLVSDEILGTVWDALASVKGVRGILASTPAYRLPEEQVAEVRMPLPYDLIQIVCNSGFSDDIMSAARKAGAGGGTIIEGRGTSNSDDVLFFGSNLVPEKELLLILLEREKTDAVFSAIQNLGCLQEKGSGIAFSVSINNFADIGR